MSLRKIVKTVVPRNLFERIEPLGHKAEAVLFNILYGFPARNLKVIGVTGTNGKTTTSYLIHRMLNESGKKTGLMTTVAYGVGDNIQPQVHHATNVGPQELMRRLKAMKREGMEWLVLETTSHALAQYRVWGVPYSVAVVTNITHEHLDYHKTFERYVAAKRSLFQLTEANKKGLQVGVVNADDSIAADFASTIERSVTYGIENGDVRAEDVELLPDGIKYRAVTADESYHIESRLAGSFNVYNTLATVCVGRTLGLTKRQIEIGIAALKEVEGRMVTINEDQPYGIIVDFAHTPDSFQKLLSDLRPMVNGKLVVMFGSAGRRDKTKRAVQGRIAGSYADEIILTEEDDRDEDGLEILDQIASGAEESDKIERDKNLFLILNREEAIEFAVSRVSEPEDLLLLLGKGHEKTIERSDGEHPWDEVGRVKDAVRDSLKN